MPEGDTLAIKLYGSLAQIIPVSETSTGKQKGAVSDEAGPILSVVAGRGFEPLTFRLRACGLYAESPILDLTVDP
jgi:hypothetical protein